jgi:zinc protease
MMLSNTGEAVVSKGTQLALDAKKRSAAQSDEKGGNERACSQKCADSTDGAVKTHKVYGAKTKTLKNGLQIVVVEDATVPRISVGVLYKVGSCDDPENVFGISHMLEHMFFHGSKRYPDYSRRISLLGGRTNAMTSDDFTMYVVDCPASALGTVLKIEADRMANFNLPDDVIFLRERSAVFEERLMHVENHPLGIPSEYFSRCLSPFHPYGQDIGGQRHHILAYTREAVMRHYHTWYKPNNAVIIVVGDVVAENVFKAVEAAFGGVKSGDVPARERVKNPLTDDFYQTIKYYSDKVESDKVSFGYRAPYHKDSVRKCRALSIGLKALFGGVVYDFTKTFIDKLGLVAELDCEFDWNCVDPKLLMISASLMPGKKAKKFRKKFLEQIGNVAKNGISEEEFERARREILVSTVYSANDGHQKIRMAFVPMATGFSLDDIENARETLEAISLAEVNAALAEVFGKKPVAVVSIYPKESHGRETTVS